MAFRSRRTNSATETWAGFVDALSTLLVVLIFALVVFMIAQFFQGVALSGRDQELDLLNSRISELTDLLQIERDSNTELQLNLAKKSADLQTSEQALDDAKTAILLLRKDRDGLIAQLADTEEQLEASQAEGDTRAARITVLEGDLERALEEVTVSRDSITLRLAEIASLKNDLDALRDVRDELEEDIARMTILLEAAQTLQEELESSLQASRAREDDLTTSLLASGVREEELKSSLQVLDLREKDLTTSLQASRALEEDLKASLQAARAREEDLTTSLQVLVIREEELETSLQESSAREEDLKTSLQSSLDREEELTTTLQLLVVREEDLKRSLQASRAREDDLTTSLQLRQDENERLAAQLAAAQQRQSESDEQLKTIRQRNKDAMTRLALLIVEARKLQSQTDSSLEDQLDELAEGKARLDSLIASLASERDRSKQLEARLSDEKERTLLAQEEIDKRDIRLTEIAITVAATEEERRTAEQLSENRLAQIVLLNKQLDELRNQLAELGEVLEAAEKKAEEDRVQIANLGERLNAALAAKVQELSRYRSEFLQRLSEIVADKPNIRVVGDRFLLQSELLFERGSAEISSAGRRELEQIARLVSELTREIPADIDWVLRVDGHTDTVPIGTAAFPSNWELSTARSTSVVRYLIRLGVPPYRLMAAGLGQYHPVDRDDDEIAMRRNRRIEFKITEQ